MTASSWPPEVAAGTVTSTVLPYTRAERPSPEYVSMKPAPKDGHHVRPALSVRRALLTATVLLPFH